MAVPKRKTSLQKKRQRRSHHAIGKPVLSRCKNCGSYIKAHRVCPECGFYKDSIVMPVSRPAAN